MDSLKWDIDKKPKLALFGSTSITSSASSTTTWLHPVSLEAELQLVWGEALCSFLPFKRKPFQESCSGHKRVKMLISHWRQGMGNNWKMKNARNENWSGRSGLRCLKKLRKCLAFYNTSGQQAKQDIRNVTVMPSLQFHDNTCWSSNSKSSTLTEQYYITDTQK